jgi:hypothetical protein|tara:strand:+ start:365 stop:535 length:171 start_codon:yes stop_codon:yes gene_type:complete
MFHILPNGAKWTGQHASPATNTFFFIHSDPTGFRVFLYRTGEAGIDAVWLIAMTTL